MLIVRGRGVLTALTLLAVAALVSAQITFSRDWTGGKRDGAAPLGLDCSQFARLCRHFLHDMKAAFTVPEVDSPGKRRHTSDEQPSYDDE